MAQFICVREVLDPETGEEMAPRQEIMRGGTEAICEEHRDGFFAAMEWLGWEDVGTDTLGGEHPEYGSCHVTLLVEPLPNGH